MAPASSASASAAVSASTSPRSGRPTSWSATTAPPCPSCSGSPTPTRTFEALGAGAVSAPSLHHFGLADQLPRRRPMVESVRDALAAARPGDRSRATRVPTTPSTTPTSISTTRRPRALAWARTTAFLADHLPAVSRMPEVLVPPARLGALGRQLRRPARRRRARRRTTGPAGSRPGRVDVRGRAALRRRRTTDRPTGCLRRGGRAAASRGGCCSSARAASRSPGWPAPSWSRTRSGSATCRAAPRRAARASSGSPGGATTRRGRPTRRPPTTPYGSSPAGAGRRSSPAATARRSRRCWPTRGCAACGRSSPGSPCPTRAARSSTRRLLDARAVQVAVTNA